MRLIAPVLSFTADEIWDHMPPVEGRAASVHLALFPEAADYSAALDGDGKRGSTAGVERARELRPGVLLQLEAMRTAKQIGKSLEAALVVPAGIWPEAELPRQAEIFGVSQVMAGPVDQPVVQLAQGSRCERCWRVLPELAHDARWPNVCSRCVPAIEDWLAHQSPAVHA